ncbi:MAG TPA: type II secretion system F family protein [Gammaproteobacteria bacterium]|jgi:type IV pilus assembly protein PilC
MAKYSYKAVNSAGRIIEGEIEAANESDLELRISHMDLELIRFNPEKRPLFTLQRKLDPQELITFTYHLEQLLHAGVPLIEALQDLRDSVRHGYFRDVLAGLIEAIGTGKTFSQALAAYPKVFGSVYSSMVYVGENSGQLVRVLNDLSGMLRWQYELIAKAKRMMVYPTFVFAVVSMVIVFLMTYLVPKLVPFIRLAGEEISWHTQALIDTSGFFIDYWYVLLGVTVALATGLKLLAALNKGIRRKVDALKLRIWLIGPISTKIKMARFCNYFALMYASGITILNAIKMSKHVMNNLVLEEALDRVHEQITEGESIHVSFANVGLFPALVVRMVRVGENTGAMSEALMNVSYFYDREVNNSINALEPLIMPCITVFLGMIVGWIMLSIMGPIYDAVVSLSAFY